MKLASRVAVVRSCVSPSCGRACRRRAVVRVAVVRSCVSCVSSVVRIVRIAGRACRLSCVRVAPVRADVPAACFGMRIPNCASNPERADVRESV
jgi:hypothetical protein